MSRKRVVVTLLSAVAMSGSLWAQEPADKAEEPARAPVQKITVLENPYDIASFYRSHQGEGFGFFGSEAGLYGYGPERYPIAGFYRQHPPLGRYGYSRFWTSGYGFGRVRPGIAFGYRRSIGENGDLFLLTPTILAPVGPLTGIFYDGR